MKSGWLPQTLQRIGTFTADEGEEYNVLAILLLDQPLRKRYDGNCIKD